MDFKLKFMKSIVVFKILIFRKLFMFEMESIKLVGVIKFKVIFFLMWYGSLRFL